MATRILEKIKPWAGGRLRRSKTSSAHYVASRPRDPTLEKLMEKYKNFLKVVAVQDLILASSDDSVTLDFLSRLSQRLHLNRGPAAFLRKYPHVFHIFASPEEDLRRPRCTLTPAAYQIVREEAEAIGNSLPLAVARLVKLLSMSPTGKVPLRAVFKVWKELGLPDDFEDSVIAANPETFSLRTGNEINTHYLVLNDRRDGGFIPAVENWRVAECCKGDSNLDRTTLRYSFKHSFPPGMILKKSFKAKVKEWQLLPYTGPYEDDDDTTTTSSKHGKMRKEKRAVGIVHEFMNLTVEKMIEVEKMSHFRKWFGMELNVRDLFLDHPGMFYLSTKGKRHTVFLREAYERGCLIESNPVYAARRKLLNLVLMGRRGLPAGCCAGKTT
ncbi:hypothetical protein M569_01046 [Genlisea aurea]|uniref:PORR domain-containing protein n=1 Tax=Genlisea aurea TaxID=192259 RepID=S8ECN0_9LAMI|nr:hypothetical protein M569_01046 [Genlisea aurea]